MALRRIRSILVRRVDNMGDMIILLPVLRELRRFFPEAAITLMVKPPSRPLFTGYAEAFMDPQPERCLDRLCKQFDVAINVAYSLPDGYEPRPIRAGGGVYHVGAPHWDNSRHVYKLLLDGLRAHDLPVSYARPRLKVPLVSRQKAHAHLNAMTPPGSDPLRVAICGTSAFKRKCWPEEYYLRICRWLIAEFGAQLFFLGSSKRETFATRLRSSLPRSMTAPVLGKPLDDVAALIANMDLLVGNDSGPGHIAASLNVTTVTIFGPTAPKQWKPVSGKSVVVYPLGDCYSCGYNKAKRCGYQECLLEITPTQVADGILFALNNHVGRDSHPALDSLMISPHLEINQARRATVLRNTNTGHSCLIQRGWPFVHKFLDRIEHFGSYTKIVYRHPQHRALLDMFLLHRFVVSSSPRLRYRPL